MERSKQLIGHYFYYLYRLSEVKKSSVTLFSLDLQSRRIFFLQIIRMKTG